MSLVLSGTTGVADVDGSAATPAIRGTDSNTGIFFPAADTIAFAEGGAEVARFDSSGNVGIGTSSPSSFNSSANKLVIGSGTGNNGATIYAGSASQAAIYFADGTAGAEPYAGQFIYNHADNSFITYVNGTTLATKIDSSGNLLVNTTSAIGTGARVQVYQASGTDVMALQTNTTSTQGIVRFYNPNGAVGNINTSGSATAYATSSDYRLKNTVAPMTGALAKVAALKPCTYKWNADGSDGEGFIAHELAEVVPQCVSGEKDAVDAEGNPVYQGIDTSFLVATLTAAIQEQQALIASQSAIINAQQAALTALTARVEALENK